MLIRACADEWDVIRLGSRMVEGEHLPEPLEYAAPAQPVSASRVFAGVLGVGAALLGLLIGAGAAWIVVRAWLIGPAMDRASDTITAMILLAIATVLVLAAFFWCRDAFRKARPPTGAARSGG